MAALVLFCLRAGIIALIFLGGNVTGSDAANSPACQAEEDYCMEPKGVALAQRISTMTRGQAATKESALVNQESLISLTETAAALTIEQSVILQTAANRMLAEANKTAALLTEEANRAGTIALRLSEKATRAKHIWNRLTKRAAKAKEVVDMLSEKAKGANKQYKNASAVANSSIMVPEEAVLAMTGKVHHHSQTIVNSSSNESHGVKDGLSDSMNMSKASMNISTLMQGGPSDSMNMSKTSMNVGTLPEDEQHHNKKTISEDWDKEYAKRKVYPTGNGTKGNKPMGSEKRALEGAAGPVSAGPLAAATVAVLAATGLLQL